MYTNCGPNKIKIIKMKDLVMGNKKMKFPQNCFFVVDKLPNCTYYGNKNLMRLFKNMFNTKTNITVVTFICDKSVVIKY